MPGANIRGAGSSPVSPLPFMAARDNREAKAEDILAKRDEREKQEKERQRRVKLEDKKLKDEADKARTIAKGLGLPAGRASGMSTGALQGWSEAKMKREVIALDALKRENEILRKAQIEQKMRQDREAASRSRVAAGTPLSLKNIAPKGGQPIYFASGGGLSSPTQVDTPPIPPKPYEFKMEDADGNPRHFAVHGNTMLPANPNMGSTGGWRPTSAGSIMVNPNDPTQHFQLPGGTKLPAITAEERRKIISNIEKLHKENEELTNKDDFDTNWIKYKSKIEINNEQIKFLKEQLKAREKGSSAATPSTPTSPARPAGSVEPGDWTEQDVIEFDPVTATHQPTEAWNKKVRNGTKKDKVRLLEEMVKRGQITQHQAEFLLLRPPYETTEIKTK